MTVFSDAYISVVARMSFVKDFARPGSRVVDILPWWYGGKLAAGLAPATRGVVNIQTQADSDFICTSLSALNASTRVQVTDTSTGKTFFNAQTDPITLFGSQGFPYVLASPRLVNPNSNLKVDVFYNPLGFAPPNSPDMFFAFGGVRVYYEANPS